MTLLDRGHTFSANPIERRVCEMDTLRYFVAQLLSNEDGLPNNLSDEEWAALCAHARGAKNEEMAIARVVLEAHRLRQEKQPSTHPVIPDSSTGIALDPSVLTPVDVVPFVLDIPVDFGVAFQLPIPHSFASSPSDHLALPKVDRKPQPVGFVPLPIPSVSPEPSEERDHKLIVRRLRRRAHAKPKRKFVLNDRRRERWLTVASWIRNIGVIILLFVAWQLWGTAITQHHSQTALHEQFNAQVHRVEVKSSPTFALTPATVKIPDPPQGTVMAQLQIPKIGLNEYVVSGTDTDDLAKGPGHYLGTAMPGQAGNVVIAGHRTTHGAPFNRLAELAPGDPIYLTNTSGQKLTYIVAQTPYPVSPSDVTVLNNFGDNRLTLTTCNPEYSAAQRLIVVAAYQPAGATHPTPIAKGTGMPYKLAPASAAGWNTSLLPLVLVLVAALVALGMINRRLSGIYRREGRWIILVPVWTALLIALFETLTNFLPAAV